MLNGELNDEWSVATGDDSSNKAGLIKYSLIFRYQNLKKASRSPDRHRDGTPFFNDCLPYEKCLLKLDTSKQLTGADVYRWLFSIVIVFEMRNEV